MLNWQKIDTVLLDMDGTLLDLNFDNHFWQEFVPQNFAKQQQITLAESKRQLVPQFEAMQGKLEWYCLDYWSEVLQLDIVGLKREISGLISVLPHVTDFLTRIKQSPQRVILVTNAHRDSLNLKMEKTCLQHFFNELVSSHDFGKPKEHADFWPLFQRKYLFDPQRTVLIDDNLAVLSSARAFGIKHVVSISLPDTSKVKRAIDDYPAIEDFRELMPGL
jgi:putative hydrolase of the HAD superfamily